MASPIGGVSKTGMAVLESTNPELVPATPDQNFMPPTTPVQEI